MKKHLGTDTMKMIMKNIIRILYAVLIFMAANLVSVLSIWKLNILIPFLVLGYLFINILPSFYNLKMQTTRLKVCANGCELLILFLISASMSVIYSISGFFGVFSIGSVIANPKVWLLNTLVVFFVEAVVFWNGIIRVYMTSAQLGIKWRIIGAICGMIPIAHLVVLGIIIRTVAKEVSFENDKILLNQSREKERICATKYPILMVHGVFFRDLRYFNYWGRVPKELEKNGAKVYYGNHASAASVEECGKELAERIKTIVEETGCEKVNIIAHSKGGLDSRYAISMLEMSPYVATLTTINTPHRGCEFADYLLSKIPEKQKEMMANAYNTALRKLGDHNPDFIAAVTDLTASACKERNETVLDAEEVFYQSVGSKLNHASSGRFPLNFSYKLVEYFDGRNDGLVGETSFPWGEKFDFLMVKGKRGISHGDMIDLNRENFDGFDVREYFVELVADLKKRGF